MWAERALDTWSVLERDAIRESRSGTRVLEGPGGRRASLWPLAHVLWAAAEVLHLGGTPPIDRLHGALGRYRSGDAYAASPRGRRYFDDNAWLGLAMLRLGVVTAEPLWHGRAIELGRFVTEGEAPEGGVRWAEGSDSRNTCSTASAAWLLLDTNKPDARATAARWMDWLDATLREPIGLYADRIEGGLVVPDLWTYNQGAALAASQLLRRPTAGLRAAILERWSADLLWKEPPAFAAIAYRALLEDRPDATEVARVWDPYLDRLVTDARDPASGWFTVGGIGSYDGRPTIDQAAIVQMLALRSAGDQ
jgi:hypothetical protein